MSDLIYPTLDLFAYNLAEGLGDTQNDIKKRRDDFLASFPDKTIQTTLASAFEKESIAGNPEYVELLKLTGANAAFQEFDTSLNNYALKGYYYPVRLSDTYGLLFDCSVDEKDIPQKLSCLRYLKEQADSIAGDIGKTWMISGSLPTPKTDPETLARSIYKAFLAEEKGKNLTDSEYEALISQEWQYRKTGKFLSASVFELWQMPQNWQNIRENSHILIILYPNQQTMQTAAQFYEDWMPLLCYRNKIIWAYCKTQELKQDLQAGFKIIRETISIVRNKANLPQLQTTLERNIETFSSYAINLNYLEIQHNTIEVNLGNYQEYSNYLNNYIQSQATKFGDTNLKFLDDFSGIVQHKYQKQTKKDYESLRPGIDILENQLNTIRGIVEIEQAERDQRIEDVIALVGFGVGTASLVGTVFTPLVQQLTQPQPVATPQSAATTQASPSPIKPAQTSPPSFNIWLPWIVFFLICLVLGGLASWAGLTWVRSRRLHSTK